MELAFEGMDKEKAPSRKRARTEPPAEGLLQPVNLSREELYKEPTNEELNRLRETEILFHSTLLRLQVRGWPGHRLEGFPWGPEAHRFLPSPC
jgi:U3 small nucleolar RNA-associated protein 22